MDREIIVRPDDAVGRVPNVWLGTNDYRFPRPIRYTSAAIFAVVLFGWLLAMLIAYRAGLLHTGFPWTLKIGMWGFAMACLIPWVVGKFTDSDTPPGSVPGFAVALAGPLLRRTHRRPGSYRWRARHVRIRTTTTEGP